MIVSKIPQDAKSTEAWYPELPRHIDEAVRAFEFSGTSAYRSLSELASVIEIEDLTFDADSVVLQEGRLLVPGTVYVTLIYDPNSKDRVELPDAYPIKIVLLVSPDGVVVQDIEADTSSFYE